MDLFDKFFSVCAATPSAVFGLTDGSRYRKLDSEANENWWDQTESTRGALYPHSFICQGERERLVPMSIGTNASGVFAVRSDMP